MAKTPKPDTMSLRIPREYMKKLTRHKKKTGVSITAFVCQAIDEKLNLRNNITSDPLSEAEKHLQRRAWDKDYGVSIKKPKET